MSEYKVQVTVKGGLHRDAPWLNFQGDDVDEVKAQLQEAFPDTDFDSFAELVAKVSVDYAAVLNVVYAGAPGVAAPAPAAANPVASIPAQGGAPVPAAAPSGPPSPQCQHGPKTYKTGTGKTGKTWKAWMCNAPQGAPDKCDPDWIR